MAGYLGDKYVARIQNRRGRRVNLPQPLEPGEMGWCVDTKQLFIGLSEDQSTPIIETFKGTGVQTFAQNILDNYIVEFQTPYIRANTATINMNPLGTFNEVDVITELKKIPASSYFNGTSRPYIDQLESSVDSIVSINYTVIGGVSANGAYPYTTVYDIAERANTTATATITQTAGAITLVTPVSGGFGYDKAPVVTVTDGGPGINAQVTATVNGGSILKIQMDNSGTGYTVNDVLTLSSGQTSATITVTGVNAGAITTYNVTSGGYGYSITDTGLTVTGGTGNSAVFTVLDTSYGSVTGYTIVNPGSGYTSPAISIAPPTVPTGKSSTSYRYTYHIGFEKNITGNSYISTLNLETFMTYIKSCLYILSPGEIGNNANNTNVGKAKLFIGGLLTMPTPRQAANVSGLVNRIASADPNTETGLTNTKQNIEITTELNSNIGDVFVENPLEYQLPASVPYVQVLNDILSPYLSLPVEYSSNEDDVQIIDYSLYADEGGGATMVRTGTLRILTLANGVDDISIIDDNYTENRGSLIAPVVPSGPDFDFDAYFDSMNSKIILKYRHSFTNRVTLKFTTRRWHSF